MHESRQIESRWNLRSFHAQEKYMILIIRYMHTIVMCSCVYVHFHCRTCSFRVRLLVQYARLIHTFRQSRDTLTVQLIHLSCFRTGAKSICLSKMLNNTRTVTDNVRSTQFTPALLHIGSFDRCLYDGKSTMAKWRNSWLFYSRL